MPTILKQALLALTVPDIKDLVSHLPGGNTVGRKEELIDQIVGVMLGGASQGAMFSADLKSVWNQLDATQQSAVAEALYHPLGEYSTPRFRAKYETVPRFSEPGIKSHSYSSARRSALGLFLVAPPGELRLVIPDDLRPILRTFVVPPPAVQLVTEVFDPEGEDLVIRATEREAIQEMAIVLRTVEQTAIAVSDKTALPSAAATRLLTGVLVGGDFYPPDGPAESYEQVIGPIKAFAWPMLLQAGGLAERSGKRLTLTPAGIKALGKPTAEMLRLLWQKWLKSTLLDEFSRVDTIKGQAGKGRVMTALAPRRAVIVEALRQCPVGRWVDVEQFCRFMRASDLDFNVTHDPWKLYIADRQYGALGYDGHHDWGILQQRYLMALLFEYAATLGLIDLAYFEPAGAMDDFSTIWGTDELEFLSRYDGLAYFRINPLGAYILGQAAEYKAAAPSRRTRFATFPSLAVTLADGELDGADRLLLESWAEPLGDGLRWRLDKQRALLAIERGMDIGELRGLLESGDDMPLPEPVEAFINQTAQNGKALHLAGEATLFECRDVATAATVSGHPETKALCLRASDKLLAVRAEHLARFRERVRLLGFGVCAGK